MTKTPDSIQIGVTMTCCGTIYTGDNAMKNSMNHECPPNLSGRNIASRIDVLHTIGAIWELHNNGQITEENMMTAVITILKGAQQGRKQSWNRSAEVAAFNLPLAEDKAWYVMQYCMIFLNYEVE